MSFKRDLLNPPRKEAKLILHLLASVGSAEEAIDLVFAAGQVSMEMSKVNREGFEAELRELALERIADLTCGAFPSTYKMEE